MNMNETSRNSVGRVRLPMMYLHILTVLGIGMLKFYLWFKQQIAARVACHSVLLDRSWLLQYKCKVSF